jgi:quercetin dioxygenase-like cupin family protein
MQVEHWNEAWGEPTEDNMRRRIESEGYSVSRYDYPPGTYFPDHTHSFDKIDAVVSGHFRIRADGREFLMGAGDMLAVPAGTVHSAEVVGSDTAVSLDAARY